MVLLTADGICGEAQNKILDFLLQETRKKALRNIWLGWVDAAAPHSRSNERDRETWKVLGVKLVPIDFNDPRAAAQLKNSHLDALYLTGGNTFKLLAAIDRNGLRYVLTEKICGGLPYIGFSAGSVILGPAISHAVLCGDVPVRGLETTRGLGVVSFRVLPHYPKSLQRTLSAVTKKITGAEMRIIPNGEIIWSTV